MTMNTPAYPLVATLRSDVPMYRPTETASPITLMLVQMGVLPIEEAVDNGEISKVIVPSGTTAVVIEECSGECGIFQETGVPCSYVVRWDNGPLAGEEAIVAGEEVTVHQPTWSDVDDAFLYSEAYGPEEWDDAFSAEFPSDDPDDDPRYF